MWEFSGLSRCGGRGVKMFGFYEKLDWDLIGSEILLDSFL